MATQVTQPVEPEVKQNEPEVDEATGKFIYSYQPRDSEGQFIGKPYRFLYTDHQDLIRQITEAKENGDRFIYEVKSGKRQIVGEAAIKVPDFKPAPESQEEEEKKKREEFRKTAEQEFGAPLDDVRNRLKRAGELDEYLIGQKWAMENEANGYYICPQNARDLMKHLKEKNLRFSAANLDLVFEELRDSLVQAPKEPVVEPADSTQQRTEVKPQSTGIIPGQFAGTRQPGRQEKRPLTVERFRQIDKMSRDQWKRLERENPNDARAFLAMKYPAAQPQQ
jgi:hypothetical protein